MNAGQRKSHKLAWLAISTILVVLLFFSIREINFSILKENDRKEMLTVEKNANDIHIVLHKAFANPSAVVYELTPQGKQGALLGQLSGVGNYTFEASKNSKGILIIDQIKNEELYKSEF